MHLSLDLNILHKLMNVLLKLGVKGNNNVDGYNTKFFRMLCIRYKITTNKCYKSLKRRDWFLCGTKTWKSRETKIITNSKCTIIVNTNEILTIKGKCLLSPSYFSTPKSQRQAVIHSTPVSLLRPRCREGVGAMPGRLPQSGLRAAGDRRALASQVPNPAVAGPLRGWQGSQAAWRQSSTSRATRGSSRPLKTC